MYLTRETIDFFQFIAVGIFLALIFDFFRAYRKYKKVNTNVVVMQDIIYFIITGIVLILVILKFLDGNIRFHLFIAIIIGACIYVSTISGYVMKMYIKMLKIMLTFTEFLILPVKLFLTVIKKINVFLKKYIKKCCNMLHNVILIICTFSKKGMKKVKNIKPMKLKLFKKQKRVTNEKIS